MKCSLSLCGLMREVKLVEPDDTPPPGPLDV